MQHVITYNAAPEPDRFRCVDAEELSAIGLEISGTPPPEGAPEWARAAYKTDLEAIHRALTLQRAGATILVARDEDGYFFGVEETQTMTVTYYRGNELARTDTDAPGRCIITWINMDPDLGPVGEPDGYQCDGWIEGDKLFAPADGTDSVGTHFGDDGISLYKPEQARWYEVETGKPAIIGLPGSTMAVFE